MIAIKIHCNTHPEYTGETPPTPNCEGCEGISELAGKTSMSDLIAKAPEHGLTIEVLRG